jgi:hypothetical protein
MELILHRLRGTLAEQRPRLRELTTVLPIRTSHQLLALAELDAGDTDAAVSALDASLSAPRIPWMEVLADTVEAEIRAALPPSAAAEALVDALAPHEDLIAAAGTTYWWGPVALSVAALEHRLGRFEQAEARLRRTIERTQGWELRVWTAQAQWRLAAVLADRGANEEAHRLRVAAQTAATDIGMALPGS